MSSGNGSSPKTNSPNNKPNRKNNGQEIKNRTTTRSSPSKNSPTIPRSSSSSLLNKEEMAKYVLWRRPIKTLYYFALELVELIVYYLLKFLGHRKLVTSILAMSLLITVGFNIEGSHLATLLYLRKNILWCAYWVGLGIASSIGLGTGLHTFLLYLGPFIAEVTLAAYECNSLKFPEPPYPDEIMCPGNDSLVNGATISILSIMAKVRLEVILFFSHSSD